MAFELQPCEWMTGLPPVFYNLLVTFQTDGSGDFVQFYVDKPSQVDWGDGIFLNYKEGIVYGRQLTNTPVIVRSAEEVTEIRFGDGNSYNRQFKKINILKAYTLTTAYKMCYRLEELTHFVFMGTNQITNFDYAWAECTELIEFIGMDTSRAQSFRFSWHNCQKLVSFPNIYATECSTVECAWKGCTEMVEFPIIDVSNCIDFSGAWRGNTKLQWFPYMDTSSGQFFNYSWSHCDSLIDFPSLDFSSALEMDYTFSYMHRIRRLPWIDTPLSTRFKSTFECCLELTCIDGIDTNGVSSRDYTIDIFKDTPKLVAPNEIQQERIRDGWRYDNPGHCHFNVGRSHFFVVALAIQCEIVTFTVTGGDVEVDWGDGIFFAYGEGTIEGVPVADKRVIIRSEEDIASIVFNSDTFTDISIYRAYTMQTFEAMCMDLTKLKSLEIAGYNYVENYNYMCLGCTSLENIDYIDFTNAKTMRETFKDCKSLKNFKDEIDISSCTDFHSTFRGLDSATYLPTLLTNSGQIFDYMFADNPLLTCIWGVDTRNQISTQNMFYNTPVLERPNPHEQQNILTGSLYNNNGNCDSAMSIMLTGTGSEITVKFDRPVDVDWGDGVIETFLNGVAVGYPIGDGIIYMYSDASTVDFATDNVVTVDFLSADYVTSMESVFEGAKELRSFTFSGNSNVTSYYKAFLNSGIESFQATNLDKVTNVKYMFAQSGLVSVGDLDLSQVADFEYMFFGTTQLDRVGIINSVNGIYFEHMFEDSGLNILCGINTCKGQFDPIVLDCYEPPMNCIAEQGYNCDTDVWDCEGDLACPSDVEYDCSIERPCGGLEYSCSEEHWLFGGSTMFENATPVSPTQDEIHRIINRWEFRSSRC